MARGLTRTARLPYFVTYGCASKRLRRIGSRTGIPPRPRPAGDREAALGSGGAVTEVRANEDGPNLLLVGRRFGRESAAWHGRLEGDPAVVRAVLPSQREDPLGTACPLPQHETDGQTVHRDAVDAGPARG